MKILIADDDADLRDVMSFTLMRAGFDVCTASSGEKALQTFSREIPEFVLLDINMPEPDGLEVCRVIRTLSNVPIMFLTVRSQEDDLVAAFDAGADDFMHKPCSPRALVARVRALARRAQPLFAGPLIVGALQLDTERYTLQIGAAAPLRLTPLELKAIHLLMTTPGRTVTVEKLLLHLWGISTARERRTLKQLIYRLRQKFESDPAEPQLLQTTTGVGYKLVV